MAQFLPQSHPTIAERERKSAVNRGQVIDLLGTYLLGGGIVGGPLTARQWQSALASQAALDAVRDAIPADANDPITIQWFAAGMVRPPPASDPIWAHTKATLAYSDAQMLALYDLAQTQDA